MIKVSVVVITYNFEKYILETLNSLANQTYKNIELVISDDHSTDHTNFIIEKWLEENKERCGDDILEECAIENCIEFIKK